MGDGIGLSPRVRGNPSLRRRRGVAVRSIPACTGKPHRCPYARCMRLVYPRVYGETGGTGVIRMGDSGLSPRVRGNLERAVAVRILFGSIPACTGKPATGTSPCRRRRVYPRVYGETVGLPMLLDSGGGLSPRVRGNPSSVTESPFGQRSIPACTGKPAIHIDDSSLRVVYPRVYGETGPWLDLRNIATGLSPRVRGNHAGP